MNGPRCTESSVATTFGPASEIESRRRPFPRSLDQDRRRRLTDDPGRGGGDVGCCREGVCVCIAAERRVDDHPAAHPG